MARKQNAILAVPSLAALATFMALATLSAAAPPAAAKQVTIKFWNWTAPYPQLIKVEKQIIAEFERANPGIKVKYEAIGEGSFFWDKVLTSISAGVAPDVSWCDNVFGPMVASKGLFADLRTYAAADRAFDLDDFIPSSLAALSWGKALYALPEGCSGLYALYNQDLFDKAGVVAPKGEYSWDDAVVIAQKTTVTQGAKTTQWGLGGLAATNWISQMSTIFSFGGELWSDDAKKCLLGSRESTAGIQQLVDLVRKYHVVGGDFAGGRTAMYHTGYWDFQTLPSKLKFRWGAMVVPKGVRTATWLGVGGPAVLKGTKHPKEAWAFAKFRVSRWAMLLDHSDGHSFPTRKSMLATREFLANPKVFPPATHEAILAAASYMHAIAPVRNWSQIQPIFETNINAAIQGKISAQEAGQRSIAPIERWLNRK